MPRIIVTTAPARLAHGRDVLLDEEVCSVHLSTDHAALQLVERLAWAVGDAEVAEKSTRREPRSLNARRAPALLPAPRAAIGLGA